MKNQDYGIGEACVMTGLTEKQLRYWEEKGFIPKTPRVICGQRAYRRYDEGLVELVITIKTLMDEGGMTLAGAARKAKAMLSKGGDSDAE